MDKRAHIIIKGRVQGVLYRVSAKNKAGELGLTGNVKNLPEDTVEIIAEGPQEKLKEFVQWCWKGPEGAQVKNVAVVWYISKKQFKSFEIEH